MNFANINTGEIRLNLDPVLVLQGRTITGATLADYQELGWRKVVAVDAPEAGYRVTAYGVQEIDATTCKLTVATSVNIADELAAQAAADLTAQKAGAKAILAGTSDETQRALRAFAELTLTRDQHAQNQGKPV